MKREPANPLQERSVPGGPLNGFETWHNDSTRRLRRNSLAAVLLIIIAVGTTGYFYLSQRQAGARAAAHSQLSAIADLKLNQLNSWREERLADARFFAHAPFVASDLQNFFQHPESEEARQNVLRWLRLLKSGDRYYEVIVYDAELKPRLSLPDSASEPAISVRDMEKTAEQTGDAVMTDLHRDSPSDPIHLQILFPVYQSSELEGADTGTRQVVGVILLKLDAQKFLAPLIRSWPVASRTAETLLVRREGSDVLFLTELRHRPNSALNLRIPINTPELPAARAVRGDFQAEDGIDYRGVPVVAVGRLVPGTPWAMIAKVDQQELYEPLRRETITVCLGLVALALAGGLLVALLWRQRRSELLQESRAELSRLNAQLEQRVQERTAELEAKNRELETFAYSVSHDLKAPLRGIEGFTKLLLDEYSSKLDETGRRYLERSVQSAERMHQLIDDLLSYSRLELNAVNWSRVDLRDLVSRLVGEFQSEIEKSKTEVAVELECDSLVTDKEGIEQAIRNLVGNAIKFSGKSPQPRVVIRCSSSGGVARFEVRDNGIGFDMSYRDQIFQIFHRLHASNEYPGTGVGLAIVRKAMQRVGGRATAESESGKGARFVLEIPLHKEAGSPEN